MMNQDELRIRLFGELEVRLGERLIPALPTVNATGLLAYLVLHRERAVHRDVVCGALWGERAQKVARKTLRTALWRVNGALGEIARGCGGKLITVQGGQVRFSAPAWVDVDEFRRCLAKDALRSRPLDRDGASGLVRAVALYRADLLEGLYADWCVHIRERLRLDYLQSLEQLVEFHEDRAQWMEAVYWGTRLLLHDPLRENVHRALMLCHLARGDRPSALRQYQRCRRILREELGIGPMDETRSLHQRILEGIA